MSTNRIYQHLLEMINTTGTFKVQPHNLNTYNIFHNSVLINEKISEVHIF